MHSFACAPPVSSTIAKVLQTKDSSSIDGALTMVSVSREGGEGETEFERSPVRKTSGGREEEWVFKQESVDQQRTCSNLGMTTIGGSIYTDTYTHTHTHTHTHMVL